VQETNSELFVFNDHMVLSDIDSWAVLLYEVTSTRGLYCYKT
jgi:hypothetical protein